MALKEYFWEELKDLNNRLWVLSDLGNVSCSHETTAILKPEISFLRDGNKNNSIIIQNENLLPRNKDERNIKCNVDVNKKINFSLDEIFMTYSKTFMKSKSTRNNRNNVKFLPGFSHSSWYRRHYWCGFWYNVSPANECVRYSKHWTVCGEKEKQSNGHTRGFYSEKNTRKKVWKKGQTKCYR